MRRVIRFIKALWRYILYGNKVSFTEYVNRLNICRDCIELNPDINADRYTCKICGCYLTKKVKMSTEKCPKNKW